MTIASSIDVLDFGARCDGTTDDAKAFQDAFNAAKEGVVTIGAGLAPCRIASRVDLRSPVKIAGQGATILFDFPTSTKNADGGLFNIMSSDLEIDGINIRGTDATATSVSVNRYAIIANPRGTARYSNIIIRNCRFTNLMQYSGKVPATRTVEHAIYLRQVDRATIEGNVFHNISGSPVFLGDTNFATVVRNEFSKFGWSGILLHNSNRNWSIAQNNFCCTTQEYPSFWGGAIDAMGQTSDQTPPGLPDTNGVIANNRFVGGYYRYGQVLRLASSHSVEVVGNLFDKPDVDQIPPFHQIHITLSVRDITLNNGPHKNITIHHNKFIAKGAGTQKAIFVITTSGSRINTSPSDGLIVEDNEFVATDSDNYFGSLVYLNGLAAGYNNVKITNNVGTVSPAPRPEVGTASSGAVVLVTDPGTRITNVIIEGNQFEFPNWTAARNNQCAVNIGRDILSVKLDRNVFKHFACDVLTH
jgi:polygalacturonase